MKPAFVTLLVLIATPALASEVDEATLAKIDALLKEQRCEVDPVNVEAARGGGYELDDVYCADGRYDMELDASLAVTGKKKEGTPPPPPSRSPVSATPSARPGCCTT